MGLSPSGVKGTSTFFDPKRGGKTSRSPGAVLFLGFPMVMSILPRNDTGVSFAPSLDEFGASSDAKDIPWGRG
jgi:hypothetical protein